MQAASQRIIILLVLCIGIGGCKTYSPNLTGWLEIKKDVPAEPIPEQWHLDAGIARFTGELTEQERASGTGFAQVRIAETLYLPQQLRQAMLRSGGWRNVWLVPARALTDLRIEGKILHSDGTKLKLEIKAADATGALWLERTYEHEFSEADYAEQKAHPTDKLFDQIAADLLHARDRQGVASMQEIRSVAELRFAREFAPQAMARHLSDEKDGRVRLVSLPARDDTIYWLTLQLKERDDLFLETVQNYSEDFAARIDAPYRDWARQSYFERAARDEVVAKSWLQGIISTLAIVGGVAVAVSSDTPEARELGQVLAGVGAYGVYDAYQDHKSTEIHEEALKELGQSLDLEVEPQVVEVENRTRTLTGSIEQQYQQWHEVLTEVYQSERGGSN